MDLKPIGSAASLGETAIHNKMASCSVDAASVTRHMQEIAKKCRITIHVLHIENMKSEKSL